MKTESLKQSNEPEAEVHTLTPSTKAKNWQDFEVSQVHTVRLGLKKTTNMTFEINLKKVIWKSEEVTYSHRHFN